MTAFIALGVILGLAVAVPVVKLMLDDVAERHEGPGVVPFGSAEGWWPDADQPVDLELTTKGHVAADLPGAYLDELHETWEPGS